MRAQMRVIGSTSPGSTMRRTRRAANAAVPIRASAAISCGATGRESLFDQVGDARRPGKLGFVDGRVETLLQLDHKFDFVQRAQAQFIRAWYRALRAGRAHTGG